MGMLVKANNIDELNEELDLFKDDEWDFLNIPETSENFEYFNDVQDIDFLDLHSKLRIYLPVTILGVVVFIIGLISIQVLSSNPSEDTYIAEITNKTQYIDGKEADSELYIDSSKILQDYFNILASGKDYNKLNDYCLSNSSFSDAYYSRKSKVGSTYDKYDSYIRAFSSFGKNFKCNKVNKVIEKDGTYYVYVSVVAPTKESIREYINLHKYNTIKHFNSAVPSNSEISKFIVETLESNPISCNTTELCLEFTKSGGKLKLTTDSEISGMCDTAYNYALSTITRNIGEGTMSRH